MKTNDDPLKTVEDSSQRCQQCGTTLNGSLQLGFCQACLLHDFKLSDPIPNEPSAAATWLDQVLDEISKRPFLKDRYDIREQLNQGGQGEVWRVRDRWLGRDLAMKRIQMDCKDFSNHKLLFLQEAQIGSQLPVGIGALPVFDLGIDDQGRLFFTTAILPGTTYRDVIRRARSECHPDWTLVRALQLFVQICETLGVSHDRGLAHRDLKPNNVLVGELGDLFVIDWGSAGIMRTIHPLDLADKDGLSTSKGEGSTTRFNILRENIIKENPEASLATAQSGIAITIDYTPPEFFFSSKLPSGHRMDMYAAGVILFELLVGGLPYHNLLKPKMSLEEVREVFRTTPHPKACALAQDVPAELAAICDKAMAYEARDRYPNMHALADDIRAYLNVRVVKAYNPGWRQELLKWIKRNPAAFRALAACLVASLVAVLAYAGKQAADKREAEARTAQVAAEAARKMTAQASALRQSELHRRNGRWKESLAELENAEKNGFNELDELALRRLEIAYVTADSTLRDEQIHLLREMPLETSSQPGLILIRLGEYDLYDEATWSRGVELVEEALELSLPPAEKAFGQGLIAPTSPEALDYFTKAIELDPLHISAHRQAFGLEMFLGRQASVLSHLPIFEAFFPDDPTIPITQATLAFMNGRNEEAVQLMENLAATYSANYATRLYSTVIKGFTLVSKITALGGVDDYLNPTPVNPATLMAELFSAINAIPKMDSNISPSKLRSPNLPCFRNALDPFRSLIFDKNGNMLSFLQMSMLALNGTGKEKVYQAVSSAVAYHPEAILYSLSADFLDTQEIPENGNEFDRLIQVSDLREKATNVDCMYPPLIPLLHVKAAEAALLAYEADPEHRIEFRKRCFVHMQHCLSTRKGTRLELAHYAMLAERLRSFDVAIDLYKQAIDLHGKDQELVTLLANAYEADGNLIRANALRNQLKQSEQ